MTSPETDDSRHDREVSDLWRTHHKDVLGYLINLGAPRDLAEEIAADAFLAARAAWPKVRDYDSPKAFVFKVANVTLSRKWVKEQRWREQLAPDLPEEGSSVDTVGLETLVKSDVQAALTQLPPSYREVILLRHFGDFSIAETAAILRLSEGTVKSYASVARAKLAEILADYQDGRRGC